MWKAQLKSIEEYLAPNLKGTKVLTKNIHLSLPQLSYGSTEDLHDRL